jgi:hypothetical protein
VGVAWNGPSLSIFETAKAGFSKMKGFNVKAHRLAGRLAYWLWVLVIPLSVLTSCAPPVQKTVAPSVKPPPTSKSASPVPTMANTPTPLPEPSATFTPLPVTATVASTVATSDSNLKTDAVKFTGDVQFPEVLEKMRQDIFYLKGVTDVKVGYGEVDVTYDPNKITLKQIETVIEDHGYHVQE